MGRDNQVNKKILISFALVFMMILTTGFTSFSNKPHDLYRVYLKGESLGLIKLSLVRYSLLPALIDIKSLFDK